MAGANLTEARVDLQHINAKLFLQDPEAVDLKDFIRIFNTWIQRRVTDELLIDVADYAHVYAGPGLLLIGHEANYSLDNAGNRLGLLYNRKAPIGGSNPERLTQALRAALQAARRLEQENGLKFNGGDVQIVVNDRLIAPNTAETLAALSGDLGAVFGRLFGGADYRLSQDADPRERFTVDVQAAAPFELSALLANLAGELAPA